jgi:hypothetical protein
MATERRPEELQPPGEGRRRSRRFPVFVPVQVRWTAPDNKPHITDVQAKEVNIHGGLLHFPDNSAFPRVGAEMDLKNLFTGEEARARSTALRRARDGALLGIAVELLLPSETFWGLTFRLKKTTSELLQLDQAITEGNIDARVLREFRDAVDYVRKTAWAVQEWQERQEQQKDTATVLPLLFMERIRRAKQLCAAVSSDMKAHDVTPETTGLEALYRSIQKLSQELQVLFEDGKAQ